MERTKIALRLVGYNGDVIELEEVDSDSDGLPMYALRADLCLLSLAEVKAIALALAELGPKVGHSRAYEELREMRRRAEEEP